MRFVSRSHREGPLGSTGGGQGDLLEQYPNLTSVLDLSPPFHYQPGDCTVHDGYTVHGAPVNSAPTSRAGHTSSHTLHLTRDTGTAPQPTGATTAPHRLT
jgi:ectoine hydroxylase-related dioxygenase (phytanoyl-CoA dioxygenase family)